MGNKRMMKKRKQAYLCITSTLNWIKAFESDICDGITVTPPVDNFSKVLFSLQFSIPLMDISESLSSVAKVKSVLEAFPKHRRLPPIEELYPVRRLEEARQEVLMKCVPFLNKVGREIKSYVEGFGDRFFESIESRKRYIESKLEESKAEVESQNKRAQLIYDIERLEKNSTHNLERTIFDEEKSMRVIKYLHEQSYSYTNYDLKDTLESLIGLVYDKNCSDRVESYEKIMNLL